jgi:predicted DNA-binding antitoxin AbrB/MazE fold protein
MNSIQAIYEGGVFRPVTPVTLPEHSVVVFEPRMVSTDATSPDQSEIKRLLSLRFNSGDSQGAARHNEHQP